MPAAPYFPVYAMEWLARTALMSAEQKGAYADLRAHAWIGAPPCTLPDDDAALAKLSGLGPARWRKVGGLIRAQFDAVDGRLRDRELHKHWLDMQAHRERRAAAGRKGGDARWHRGREDGNASSNAIGNAMPEPQSNGSPGDDDGRGNAMTGRWPSSSPSESEDAVAAARGRATGGGDGADDNGGVLDVVRACNQAMRARFGDDYVPIPVAHGDSVQIVHDWQAAGIPLDFAVRCVFTRAKRLREPVTTLRYFDRPVRERWAREHARADANRAETPAELHDSEPPRSRRVAAGGKGVAARTFDSALRVLRARNGGAE